MNHGPTPAERILIIKLGALGDVVQALGPMRAIRTHHAGAHVAVLTRPPFDALIQAAGLADEILVDPKPGILDISGILGLRRRLRQGNLDRVYDLQTSARSGHYFRLFWPGPYPEWSGIAKGCSHPHANPGRDAMHTLERQTEQLRMAGIDDVPMPDLEGIGADIGGLGLPDRYTVLVAGGARHRPAKRWPAASYRALAEKLETGPAPAVVVGTADESDLGAAITGGLAAARNLCGATSILELVSVIKGADAAVGNDSGPMHMAAVAGIPSVVLYSDDSDPTLCAQRGPAVTILRRPDLADLGDDEVWSALADAGAA